MFIHYDLCLKAIDADIACFKSEILEKTNFITIVVFVRERALASIPDIATKGDGVDQQLITYAIRNDIPQFTCEISRSRFYNSSPYIVDLQRFREEFSSPGLRMTLLKNFDNVIADLLTLVHLEFAMIGGSFIRISKDPSDMDVILYYRLRSCIDSDRTTSLMKSVIDNAKRGGIDVRMVATDVGAFHTARMTAFFAGLYAASRSNPLDRNGVILLQF